MNTENLDVVYILGTGSTWSNNEIRYSLRSLMKMSFKDVYVIGFLPHWVRGVRHIQAEDPHQEKLKNALHKLKIACLNKDISENFILMNDDFFILKRISFIKPYFRGILQSVKKNHPTKKGYYYKSIDDTCSFLAERGIDRPKDYSLHYPFIYNKKKLLKVIEEIEKEDKQLLLRTIYGNINDIGGEYRRDIKIKKKEDLQNPHFVESDVVSTSNNIVKSREFFNFIHRKYQRPSKFEKIMVYN